MVSEDIRKLYYKQYFPSELIFRWITYSQPYYASRVIKETDKESPYDKDFFLKRELSFNIKDDVYLRYKSFKTLHDFQESLSTLLPNKIDIGGIYSSPLAARNHVKNIKITQKEFFIDIDISDYADIRPCCGETAKVCEKCWPFMACAVKMIDESLREDFGFEHILWVFSGRRGIHCWVCDERERFMTQTARASIAAYLRIYKGNKYNVSAVEYPVVDDYGLHPVFRRAYKICGEYFHDLFIKQYDMFTNSDLRTRLLDIVGYKGGEKLKLKVEEIIKNKLDGDKNSSRIWDVVLSCIEEHDKAIATKRKNNSSVGHGATDGNHCSKILLTIYISFTYPRIDIEVSKQLNHLLKAPFSIHPGTGNVCIPLDKENVDDYNQIIECPNVTSLWNELNAPKKTKVENGRNKKESEKMRNAVHFFDENFLKKLEASARQIFGEYEEKNIFSN
eukprot:GAHX01001015.1.p1 GENE.GAHX01001015.1~~GAHX01001015.1.p1  ORF type:complete len:459 (-),score=70.44 GAHX01001015.1:61-1404(-)